MLENSRQSETADMFSQKQTEAKAWKSGLHAVILDVKGLKPDCAGSGWKPTPGFTAQVPSLSFRVQLTLEQWWGLGDTKPHAVEHPHLIFNSPKA